MGGEASATGASGNGKVQAQDVQALSVDQHLTGCDDASVGGPCPDSLPPVQAQTQDDQVGASTQPQGSPVPDDVTANTTTAAAGATPTPPVTYGPGDQQPDAGQAPQAPPTPPTTTENEEDEVTGSTTTAPAPSAPGTQNLYAGEPSPAPTPQAGSPTWPGTVSGTQTEGGVTGCAISGDKVYCQTADLTDADKDDDLIGGSSGGTNSRSTPGNGGPSTPGGPSSPGNIPSPAPPSSPSGNPGASTSPRPTGTTTSNNGNTSGGPRSTTDPFYYNPQDWKPVPNSIEKKMKKDGYGAHTQKGGGSKNDLYYNSKTGEVYEKPKGGSGVGSPTGANVNDYR